MCNNTEALFTLARMNTFICSVEIMWTWIYMCVYWYDFIFSKMHFYNLIHGMAILYVSHVFFSLDFSFTRFIIRFQCAVRLFLFSHFHFHVQTLYYDSTHAHTHNSHSTLLYFNRSRCTQSRENARRNSGVCT